jgi:branched-chain amino acid transport system ATP-binding protein
MNALLDVRGLEKRFGGVIATDGVDLRIEHGEILALIGPNGAGKTTLVSQLAGQLPSDRGQIIFDGHGITHLVAHERARRGLVRSFQVTRLFRTFSVIENIALAVQAVSGGSLRAWRPVRTENALFDRARELLTALRLSAKAEFQVDKLAHGEQRLLEVGIALASNPRLLLLDEPMAGMGPQESEAMEQLIATLRTRCAILLIEHDVDAVFRLADRVAVLVNGRIIASGDPAQVRNDPGVTAAYLGEAQTS